MSPVLNGRTVLVKQDMNVRENSEPINPTQGTICQTGCTGFGVDSVPPNSLELIAKLQIQGAHLIVI